MNFSVQIFLEMGYDFMGGILFQLCKQDLLFQFSNFLGKHVLLS